jgi:nitrate reductase NapE component
MNFGPVEIVIFLLIAAGVIAVFYFIRWLFQFLN